MFIKSLFISTYLTLLHITLGYSFYQLWGSGFNGLWLGVFLTAVPGVLFFDILLLARPVARTSPHLIWVTLIKLAGFLLVVINSFQLSSINFAAVSLAITCLAGWLLYDYWYSKFHNRKQSRLTPGSHLPNLSLQNEKNEPFESQQLLGHPALFLFYRGNWCPLCMAQIREIAAQYQQLIERGLKIVLISPQSEEKTRKLAARFNLPFIFAVDKNAKVAAQLGILAKNGLPMGMQALGYESDTVMPTVIMTDEKGIILFADLTDNYRVRPEPDTFLKILDGKLGQ